MKVIIMRGIPGAGKSTLAKKIAEKTGAVICSSDHYFERDGTYKYVKEEISEAWRQCENKARRLLILRQSVIIDNTNVALSDYENYIQLAYNEGAEIEIVELKVPVDVAKARGIHNVPDESYKRFVSRWQEDKVHKKVTYEID